MSGIGGIVRTDGAIDGGDVSRLSVALASRGDGDVRTWSAPRVALVHALRRTTPDARPQPFIDAVSGATVVADVRLDNRDDLLRELDRPDGTDDAELVSCAYGRWGAACVDHLLGDFAFAVWDARSSTLFAARDPFGVKPFVYCHSPLSFAFASEAHALLGVAGVPRDLDEQRIAEYLAVHFADDERTFHSAIRRLPGGCALTLRDGAITVARYWSPEDAAEVRLRSDGDYAAAFFERFTRAIRTRMSTAPGERAAALLSGGLDSSSIACVARDLTLQRPLAVYSWIFSDSPEADEREYQEIVAETGGFARRVLDSAAEPFSPWSELDQLLVNGPPYAPNFYLNLGVARTARADGVRVLLDGLGGDGAVSHGYARLPELFVRGRELALLRELRALSAREQRGVLPLFSTHVAGRLVPPRVLSTMRRALRRGSGSHGAPPWLRPTWRDAIVEDRFVPTVRARDEHVRHLRSPLIAEGLELFDRVMSQAGAEGRYPFFDRELVEFCIGLPADQKLAGGFTRVVLRRAMSGVLPEAVQWRAGKGKPGLHLVKSLRDSRDRLDPILLRESSVLEPWVDLGRLRAAYATFAGGGVLDFVTTIQLWSAAALTCWLRRPAS